MDYKRPYHVMFNAATDALEYLADGQARLACSALMTTRQEAESLVISQPSEEDEVREESEPPKMDPR